MADFGQVRDGAIAIAALSVMGHIVMAAISQRRSNGSGSSSSARYPIAERRRNAGELDPAEWEKRISLIVKEHTGPVVEAIRDNTRELRDLSKHLQRHFLDRE